MPYESANDMNLPEHIRRQAPAIRARWIAIFNAVLESRGEELAFIVANKWLLRNVVEQETVTRSEGHEEKKSFFIGNTTEFISRSEDGDMVVSFKLADNIEDMFGCKLPDFVLQNWEQQINDNTIFGDFEHKYFDEVKEEARTGVEMDELMEQKKGFAKSVKAFFDKGKLWVKAIVDKAYEKLVRNSKGVSMEASLIKDDSGNIIDGKLYGFTFADKPVITGTEVNIHEAS